MNKHWLPVIGFSIKSRWVWFEIHSPDFGIVTTELRPRLIPRYRCDDLSLDLPNHEYRYMHYFTWFFHVTMACDLGFPDKAFAKSSEQEEFDEYGHY